MTEHTEHEKPIDRRKLIRNFVIEIIIYGVLVLVYFLLVLRLLNPFLTRTFGENLPLYAVIGLLLIVAQGAMLDAVTSFLLDQIKLDRLD